MVSIAKRISQIRKVLEQERPSVALFRFFGWAAYTIKGKFSAYILGWKKSYLGPGSMVIGTRLITVGEKISIGRYAWIDAVAQYREQTFSPEIRIGQRFYASERLHISSINRVEIGDDCLFGSCVYISDHNHGSYKGQEQSHPGQPPVERKLVSHGPVIIGSNVWIGDNVIIIGPVWIGDGVVIGANSVVTRNISSNLIVAGAPAKTIKQFNFSSGQWEGP